MADEVKVDGTPNPSPETKPEVKVEPKVEGEQPKPEVKPGEQPKGDTKTEPEVKPIEGGDPAARVVPEKYELSIPEGGRVVGEELTAIAAIAKDAGWTNEEAQEQVAALHQSRVDQAERYLVETKADPELGGANLTATEQHANAVLDRFAVAGTVDGDDLRGMLNRQGLINKRSVLRFLVAIGKSMAEDSATVLPNSGKGKPAGGPLTNEELASRLYPKKA